MSNKIVIDKSVIEDENLKKLVKTYLAYTPNEEKLLDAACQVIWSHVLRNLSTFEDEVNKVASDAFVEGYKQNSVSSGRLYDAISELFAKQLAAEFLKSMTNKCL